MEAELDASLGYEKNQKGGVQTSNKRNGYAPKTLKSQYGEFQIDVPRDWKGEFEPKLSTKYRRDIFGIEEKMIFLYARGINTSVLVSIVKWAMCKYKNFRGHRRRAEEWLLFDVHGSGS